MSDDRFPKSKMKTEKQAVEYIKKAIDLSFLLKLNSYQGRELRGHNGKVYVCSRENGNVIVHTILKANEFVG